MAAKSYVIDVSKNTIIGLKILLGIVVVLLLTAIIKTIKPRQNNKWNLNEDKKLCGCQKKKLLNSSYINIDNESDNNKVQPIPISSFEDTTLKNSITEKVKRKYTKRKKSKK